MNQEDEMSLLNYLWNLILSLYNYIRSFIVATPNDDHPSNDDASSTSSNTPTTPSSSTTLPNRLTTKELSKRIKDAGFDFPSFFDGPFKEAVKTAAETSQLLLIYFHDTDDAPFLKNIISNPVFTSFVSSNFMFYPLVYRTKEGKKFARIFKVEEASTLVLVHPDSSMKLHVEKKMNSRHSIDFIMTTLLITFETFERISELSQDGGMTPHMSEMQEQDRAFNEAMERDRQLEEQKKKEEEAKVKAEAKAKAEEDAKMKQLDSLQKERDDLRLRLPSLLTSDQTALVKFRFPNGTTLSQSFPVSSNVELMYQFIHVLSDQHCWHPQPSSTMDDYELSTIFPRQLLDKPMNIGDAQLNNQTISVVESLKSE